MPERRIETAYEAWKRWIGIALLLLGWLTTAAWAASSFSARLSAVEESNKDKVGRAEYQDLKDRMVRIEDKLDAALRKK